jgi:hypothetical protein
VLKIKGFENFFLSFLNFFHDLPPNGRWINHPTPPPDLLYPGTNITSEVTVLGKFTHIPVLDHFGFWTNVTADL